MKEKLNFEAFYPHPPERVWQALTDSKALGLWLLPTDFQPKLGLRFRFDNHPRGEKKTVEGEVLAVEAGRLLRYSWDDGEAGSPSVVTWQLQPKDGGTLLRLEHATAVEAEPFVFIEANLNWRYAMYASLPVFLALAKAGVFQQPVPIVYVADEPQKQPVLKRAGFRQEEEEKTACR